MVTKYLSIQTKGENTIYNITKEIVEALIETKLIKGIVTIFIPGSTGALTTIEYEPGLLKDFPKMLDRIAPKNLEYEHDKKWQDGNGHSHVRASLIGPSITVPFINRRLLLGTWQQLIFIELDVRRRSRNLIIQIIGE